MKNETPEIMTIGETAQYLRISRSSLYKLAQEGRIPCQKIGRHWRFRRQALEKWLEIFPASKRLPGIPVDPAISETFDKPTR